MDDIDIHFPIKKNGAPLYRKHQKETIERVLNGFFSDYKYIGIEGPVGCGKSVINYTVGKCHGKKITYLTSMKTLQDQISKERWKGVRSLKGKTGYLCNADLEMRKMCGYDGDEIKTCSNCTADDLRRRDTTVEKFINAMEDIWEDSLERSSFTSTDDFMSVYTENLYPEAVKLYKFETSRPYDEKSEYWKGMPAYDENNIIIQNYIHNMTLESISCKLTYRECYHKSSRSLAKLADIRVLNPDIFFNYNRSIWSPFQYSDLMIIDECHGFDGIMQRIFGKKIPTEIINKIYGIDMSEIYNEPSDSKAVDKCISFCNNKIKGIINDLLFVKKLGNILTVHNHTTFMNVKSQSKVWEAFEKCFVTIYGRETGEDIGFFDLVGHPSMDRFREFMEGSFKVTYTGALEPVIVNVRKYLEPVMNRIIKSETAYKVKQWHKRGYVESDLICSDYVVGMYLLKLYETMVPFVERVELLSCIPGSFLFDRSKETTKLTGTQFVSERSVTDQHFIEIAIVKPGAIAKEFFYSKADRVLFSTGTWVFPETQKRKLGIDCLDLIKIQSTFDVRRRKIYVLEGYTNFSQKINDKEYFYQKNPQVFVDELESLIAKIKKLIEHEYAITPNIIVHCHTTNIAMLVASNIRNVDKYWIHLGEDAPDKVMNQHTKKHIDVLKKEFILSDIERQNDRGIIIVSPSLTEGVDFKYGKARAQIILKHPIPNVKSAYVDCLNNGNKELGILPDKDFISHLTYTSLIQQYGRVMRSDDDWGFTFTFDAKIANDIGRILTIRNEVERMNAKFFFEAVAYHRVSDQQVQFLLPPWR